MVEWQNLAKRARTERTVIIDGHAVNRESLLCAQWEAFPAFSAAVKPPPKKRKRTHDHQEWCQFCRDGGKLYMCNGCPRVFHAKCAGSNEVELNKLPQFYCPQHNCCVCWRNTVSAGGMLFRCRTCPDSFWYVDGSVCADGSEDCLPPHGELEGFGDTIAEFQLLDYAENKQAYFIRCPDCVQRFTKPNDADEMAWADSWRQEIALAEKKWERIYGEEMQELQRPTGITTEVAASQTTVVTQPFAPMASGLGWDEVTTVKKEVLDLLGTSSVKMECSPSTVTMTTEADEFVERDLGQVVQELVVSREVIVIDD